MKTGSEPHLTESLASERIDALRRLMAEADVGATLLSTGADLPYFTGYRAPLLERITMLVVTGDRTPALFVPELEAPRVTRHGAAFEVRPWPETADPLRAIAGEVTPAEGTMAIGDETWAAFLLGLRDLVPGRHWVPASTLTRRLRMRKSAAELDALREAASAADRVARRLRSERFSGRTEADLASRVAEMAVEEGHDTADFAIVGSGPNGASPHHVAGERTIEPGDLVVVDFGGFRDGYCSDTTRTFSVGDPTPEIADAFTALRAAQRAGVEAVAPGVPAADVDRAARSVLQAAGWGEYFIHRTGHGIGLEVHEHPYITPTNPEPLAAGMTFSVEPGIYVPGRFGMRIEDIVAVTDDCGERLNTSDRDLAIVS